MPAQRSWFHRSNLVHGGGSLLFFVQLVHVHGALLFLVQRVHIDGAVSLFEQHILHCVVHVHVYRAQVNLSWSPVSAVAKPVARN